MSARDDILKAADKLFGDVGFDAATTREIAELSGANKALIHYHFGNKDALLESVLDGYYERFNDILVEALKGEDSLRDRLERLIDAYVDFLAHNINFVRILQRESAGGKHMELIHRNLAPMMRMGTELLNKAFPETQSGDLASHQLFISFYGMIISYFTYGSVLKDLWGKNPFSAEALEERKRHLHRMLDIVAKEIG